MPRTGSLTLKWSVAALLDIRRLREFIEPHNPHAARRVATSLKQAANLLITHPEIGRLLQGRHDRELFVPFGQRGYVLRYRLNGTEVVVLRIWHALEDK